MTYAPSSYQPSLLTLARQGNFRAITYWINSILAPQGIHIQAETGRSGSLKMMVNFPRSTHPQACVKARQRLVRHICYRLWTLNSSSIREVRIMARVAGQRDILWRQTVRIHAPVSKGPSARQRVAAPPGHKKARTVKHDRFQILRSFLLNRLAIASFLFCYWIIYLEMTGHQTAEPPVATASQEQVQTVQATQEAEKTAIAHRPAPPNMVFKVPAQFQGQVVHEATPPPNAEKVVALTFDDGPWKQTTEQILAILKQNNIKSTFYFVGQAIQENPTIARKVFEEGHAIGNHTWRHPMENIDAATAAQELGNTARLIYEATGGVRTYLMRPPGGNLEGDLANYAKQQGYMVNMWSADSSDYMVSAPLIVDNVLSQVKPGGIVLLHDGGGDRTATVEALPQIISALRSQGYKFVTVPQLMELQAQWAAMQSTPRAPSLEATPTIPADPATPTLAPPTPAPDTLTPAPDAVTPAPVTPIQPPAVETQSVPNSPNFTVPSPNQTQDSQPFTNPMLETQPLSPTPQGSPVTPAIPNAQTPPAVPAASLPEQAAPSPLMPGTDAMPVQTETETAALYPP
jgi:peptidoglycan/xylan/chitin deacetylase (PgdA/CDA1 family)